MAYDVFISHASEDKESVARPLALTLKQLGYLIWYDEFTLKLGDSLRRSIDAGLAQSRFGVVVLSPAFFQKNWPQYELDGLVQRENSQGQKVILPIWHNVDRLTVEAYSHALANRVAASSAIGIDVIAEKIADVLGSAYVGQDELKNDLPASLIYHLPNNQKMEMVLIKPGKYLMGDKGWKKGTQPVHQVTINYSFFIGKYLVTQAQWRALMGDSVQSWHKGDDRPMERVTWHDAQSFLSALNTHASSSSLYMYRLPSEAEWEYVCRAGTTTEYSFGNTISTKLANFDCRYRHGNTPEGISIHKTTPVGNYPPNRWGVYDMHGNLWEWCGDVWHENYIGAPSDGSSWLVGGDSTRRVVRGGAWNQLDYECTSAYRRSEISSHGLTYVGFRFIGVLRKQ
jgi:formylglycine-generating enzyme required for sulfatase activity